MMSSSRSSMSTLQKLPTYENMQHQRPTSVSGSSMDSLEKPPAYEPISNQQMRVFRDDTPNRKVLYLGSDTPANSQAISIDTKFKTRTITLYASNTTSSAPVATTVQNIWTSKPIPLSLAATATCPAIEILLHMHCWPRSTFDFALPIGKGGETQAFKWKHSKGAEVKALGRKRGFILVRMDDQGVHDEPLAVWSTQYSGCRLSGDFAIVAPNAEAEFGEQWVYAVKASALCVGAIMRATQTGGAVATMA